MRRPAITVRAAIVGSLCASVVVTAARAQDITLTTEGKNLAACTFIDTVRDNAIRDLRKKIVRAGGDAALISFSSGNDITAKVYRCASASAPGGSATSAPPAVAPAPPPVISTPPPASPPPPPGEPRAVWVVHDANIVRGCRVLGTVADNDLKDLQKKASRLGGNVALLTPQRRIKGGYFGVQDYSTADVYICEATR